jgi:DNA polymerase-3 subunit epsilon
VLKYNLRFDEAFYFSKIKPWPFPGPILIHENGEKEEGYLCDRWCYLGKIKRNEDIADVCRSECVFDYDVYRILLKFLQTTANMKKVTSVPPDTSVWLDDAA